MTDLVLGIRLTADGKSLVGEVRGSAEEIRKLGQAATQSNDKTRSAAEQFTGSLKRQADTLGMTRSQTLAYEAAQHDLTAAQRESVTASISAIRAFDLKQQMLTKLRLAAATAGTIIGAFLVKSLKDSVVQAAEAEQAHLKLEAVLRATGNAAGWTKTQLDAQAESMKSRTGFDDDQVRNSMAVMLTFRQVQGETFSQALTMAADLSRLLGQDLQSSVLMLGKAMEDPEGGLLALRRAGVSFTDAAKDMIKEMVATGRQAEALEMILSTMRAQGIDRVAESMNQGLKKATRDAGQSWDDLMKAVGQTAVIKVPVEAALSSWAAYLKDMKNVIESGNWLERLAFFSVGYSSARVVDMRNPPPPQVSQETPGSVALGRQEAMREHTIAQAMGALPREGASWEALQKFWKEQEAAVARAKDQRDQYVRTLEREAATLGMTTEQATLYKAEQLGITGAQLDAVKIAAERIAAYRDEQEQLKTARQETEAYLLQSQADAAVQSEADTLRLRSQERINTIRDENKTELTLLEEHLTQKRQAVELAVIYDQISREEANRQIEMLELQHQAKQGNIFAQGVLERRRIEQMNLTQQAQFYLGTMASLSAAGAQQNRFMFNVNKAAGIGQALVNTYVGVTKAYAQGGIMGFVTGAMVLAAGLLQVANIRKQEFGAGTSAPSIGGGTAIPVTPAEGAPPTTISAPSQPTQGVAAPQPRNVHITFVGGEDRSYTLHEVVEEIIPLINEAVGLGVTLTASNMERDVPYLHG